VLCLVVFIPDAAAFGDVVVNVLFKIMEELFVGVVFVFVVLLLDVVLVMVCSCCVVFVFGFVRGKNQQTGHHENHKLAGCYRPKNLIFNINKLWNSKLIHTKSL
jgi:hypothetical protein